MLDLYGENLTIPDLEKLDFCISNGTDGKISLSICQSVCLSLPVCLYVYLFAGPLFHEQVQLQYR